MNSPGGFNIYRKIIIEEGFENRHEELKLHPEWMVSFSGFLNFVVNYKTDGPRDIHWTPMTELCGPCSINYDYITSLETISEDIKTISKQLKLPENTQFPEMNKKAGLTFQSQSVKLAKIYFEKGISREILKKVYDMFFLDFELFGYSYVEFMHEYNKFK